MTALSLVREREEEESRPLVGGRGLIDWIFVLGGVRALDDPPWDFRRPWRTELRNLTSVDEEELV